MKLQPFEYRDMRSGVVRKNSVNTFLAPANSVTHSINVNYDTIIGSAVVRPGTTSVGSQVVGGLSGHNCLGLTEFVTQGSGLNYLLAAYTGSSTSTIYYYNGTSWNTGVTGLDNSAKIRFATIGDVVYRCSSAAAMASSTDGITWGTTNCITTNGIKPTLLYRAKQRLLASGDSVSGAGHSPSRIYFSSLVDPSTSPSTITWSTDPSTGNWIDVNPDDGSAIVGFAQTSTSVLVVKKNGVYRLDAINVSVGTDNIFNIGGISQESIVECQGLVFYFSGLDIRMTDGGYPQQISRLGVQDWIDAIPQSSWNNVSGGTDGVNVYFSIGNVTLNFITYSRVVLKYSTLDQSWSVHSYASSFQRFCQYTSSNGRLMVGAGSDGYVQNMNLGTTDNGTQIGYDLQTQEIEFGNRSHLKTLSDTIAVYCNQGLASQLQVKSDDGDFRPVEIQLDKRVNFSTSLNIRGHFLTFRWCGVTSTTSPVFEGFYLENIEDSGMVETQP